MEDATVGAAAAIWHDDLSQAERWFRLLHREYKNLVDREDYQSLYDSGQDWVELEQALRDGGFGDEKVDKFVRYLDDSGQQKMDVVAELAADASQSYQVYANWTAYVEQWDGAWDGTDESWPDFVERFTYYADEQGLRPAAVNFVSDVESSSSKANAFAEHGLSVAEPHHEQAHAQAPEQVSEGGAEQAGAEQQWPAFVAHWSGAWDQNLESWDDFVARVLADADAKGLRPLADDFLSQPGDTTVLAKSAEPEPVAQAARAEPAAESGEPSTEQFQAMVETLLDDPAKLGDLVSEGAIVLEEDDEVDEPEEAVVPAA